MTPIWAVGLMTGTVLDGNIDVAMIRTDGETVAAFGPYALTPYPRAVVGMLEEAQKQALAWDFEGPEPAIFGEAEDALTRAQAAAVASLVDGAGMRLSEIGVVGFHGQTVLHRPPREGRRGATRQLGDGRLMHSLLGTKVVVGLPQRRRGGRRPGSAARRGLPCGAARQGRGAWRCGDPQPRRGRQRHLVGRSWRPGGLRHRAGQCADQRFRQGAGARRDGPRRGARRRWAGSTRRGWRAFSSIPTSRRPIRSRSTASASPRRWRTGSAAEDGRRC